MSPALPMQGFAGICRYLDLIHMTDKKLVYTSRMAIRWGDMDAMGHVNNAVYFRYLEQARIDWFSDIDCAPNPKGEGPVIISANCTFLRQLAYPGDIEIRTFLEAIGRSSFETSHEIRRVDGPDILVAEGGAKVVWVNLPTSKSTPLSDEIRARLAGNSA
jgi:acyl-CoA thioester hydrolase